MANSSKLNGRMSAISPRLSSHPVRTNSSSRFWPRFSRELPQFAREHPPRAPTSGSNRRWSEFEKGTPDGISIESDGHLRQGPGLTELVTTPSTFVWSLAVDKTGRIFAGTGSPASVLRLGKNPGEKPFTLFEPRDLSVQALRFGPDGALYAATVPGGKVYKLNPDATTKRMNPMRHGRL